MPKAIVGKCEHCGDDLVRWGTAVPPEYRHPYLLENYGTGGKRRAYSKWCPWYPGQPIRKAKLATAAETTPQA